MLKVRKSKVVRRINPHSCSMLFLFNPEHEDDKNTSMNSRFGSWCPFNWNIKGAALSPDSPLPGTWLASCTSNLVWEQFNSAWNCRMVEFFSSMVQMQRSHWCLAEVADGGWGWVLLDTIPYHGQYNYLNECFFLNLYIYIYMFLCIDTRISKKKYIYTNIYRNFGVYVKHLNSLWGWVHRWEGLCEFRSGVWLSLFSSHAIGYLTIKHGIHA